MQSNPESVIKRVVQTGDRGVTLLRQIKAISGEEGLVPLRQAAFGEMVTAAVKEDRFSGKALKGVMNRIGNETLDELLTEGQKKFLNDLANKEIVFAAEIAKGSKKEVINFLEKISRKDDRGVVGMILQPGNDRYVHIAEKVFTPERMKEIKSMALEQVFKRNASGDIMPTSSMKALKTSTGQGLEVPLKRLLRNEGDTNYEQLKAFLEMSSNMRRIEELAANTSRTAGTWHMMREIGQAISHPVSTAAAVVSQYTLARMYFSPVARKLMIQAWRLPSGSQAAIESFTKAAMIVAEEDKKEKTKLAKEE
jgi:hypothetical protein